MESLGKKLRRMRYDPELGIETCCLGGLVQAFPAHFHSHYVIGTIERGERWTVIGGEKIRTRPGDLIVFNPNAVHACQQVDERPLNWRSLNINPQVMASAAQEVTGRALLPRFVKTVLPDSKLAALVRELCRRIEANASRLHRGEMFLLLIGQLLEACAGCAVPTVEAERPEVATVCVYLEANYARPIALEELSGLTGLSKYHLLRCFARQKEITPFQYLQNIRVDRAKTLLEQGCFPLEAALESGFSDQSHFTNVFKSHIGLTPSQYRAVFQQEALP